MRQIGLYDNAGNYESKWWHDANTYSFTVIDGIEDVTPPSIDNVIISKEEVKIGDELTIEIEASDSESGFSESVYCSLWLSNESESKLISNLRPRYNINTEKFEITLTITDEFTNGRWYVRQIGLYDNAGNYKSKWWYDASTYSFCVISSFIGTANKSIKKGESFNPLEGVVASNNIDGDFTDKITYTGNVDTNTEGIYLIKYHAVGDSGYTYRDYRWITVVNNIIIGEDGTEEVYFNKDIELNISEIISSNSMTVTKDGQEYYLNENGVITEEGIYNISFDDTPNARETYSKEELNEIKKQAEENEKNVISKMTTKASDIQSENQLQFIIDKTSPEIIEIKTIDVVEDEAINAEEVVLATDKYNKVFYSYVTEPTWSKIGQQKVNIKISDAAGNCLIKEITLNVTDKCDLDKNGKVDILDLAKVSCNYNSNELSDNWNIRYDFNKDGIVDLFDLVFCSRRF